MSDTTPNPSDNPMETMPVPFRVAANYDRMKVCDDDPVKESVVRYVAWLKAELAVAIAWLDAHPSPKDGPPPPKE